MISNISFSGNVFLAGTAKNISDKKVRNSFTNYARKQDCDVIVFDNDTDRFGNKTYYTMTVKVDESTGRNIYHRIPFCFPKKKNN